jgi:hypothetical protein
MEGNTLNPECERPMEVTIPVIEQVITIYKDGHWIRWHPFDAHLAATGDESWLVNIPVKEVADP